MVLISLAYMSIAVKEMPDEDLLALLAQSRDFNAANGVTGLLLYREGFFIQVIEGGQSVIDALFGRIKQDARHFNVIQVFRKPIAERSFGQWAMGFASPDTMS